MNNKDKIKEAERIQAMMVKDDVNHGQINARVWCLLNGAVFACMTPALSPTIFSYTNQRVRCLEIAHTKSDAPKYTTSLDACYGLMRDGWMFEMTTHQGAKQYRADLHKIDYPDSELCSWLHPTPHLAFLDAVLESWIWEWENENR